MDYLKKAQQKYGDKKVLEDQYQSMKAWVGFMQKSSTDYLWNKGFHFGDWLFYRPFDDNDGRAAVTDIPDRSYGVSHLCLATEASRWPRQPPR